MGCDIHIVAQKRTADGQWMRVSGGFSEGADPFDWRQYGMFGWLVGVRNYSAVQPISDPRGLPEDFEEGEYDQPEYNDVGEHSRSWLAVSELLAVDYDQEVEDRRCTRQLGVNYWHGGMTCEPGEGTVYSLREFLGEQYMSDLERLAALGAERIVFGFDN